MGLNVFTLFVGFGLGSLVFGALLSFGFGVPLGVFSAVELAAAVDRMERTVLDPEQRASSPVRRSRCASHRTPRVPCSPHRPSSLTGQRTSAMTCGGRSIRCNRRFSAVA